ncbi:hypothetical protein [Flagellimonas eckloniae]|uniref:PepSY domain-containing protein n=1 Tax=Flagellimonas eckloniae TaxID=346185 RepID=A0A0N8WGA2_9FLAO|nr:hypothetical protein [Allomuricauda eckloniae]KQC30931.1 hypothetical protein AAY42_14300 [Allomuricauda eckloniae]
MIKCKPLISFLALLFCSSIWSQNKYEQEYRISQTEFPSNAYELISEQLKSSKRVRYYKEIDSIKKSFEVKFKKGRLHYSIEFDEHGKLEDVEFKIKEIDIPDDSWEKISDYLNKSFQKVRIVKIQQQHPVGDLAPEKVIKQALQNLILPYINYEIVFTSKNSGGYQNYEALFNADGKFLNLRKSLSSTYDHVLY